MPSTTTARLIGTGDAYLTRSGPDRVTVGSAARSLDLRTDAEVAGELQRLIGEVLPRFVAPAAPADLATDDLALYTKYRDLIHRLDLVRAPSEPVLAQLDSPAAVRLYRFIARHSLDPDEHFLSLRRRPVLIHGPGAYLQRLLPVVAAQGLSAQAGTAWLPGEGAPEAAGGRGVTVVVTFQEHLSTRDLQPLNRAYQAAGQLWVPLQITPSRLRLGPWTAPGESACTTCLARGESPAAAPAPTASPWPAWASTQDAVVHWAGGLLAHLLLRVMAPAGPAHPWGSTYTLDTDQGGQQNVRVWRDPDCPDCGAPGLRAPAWRELS